MRRRPKNKTAKYRSYARKVLITAIILSVALLFTWNYVRTGILTALIRVSRGETGTLSDTVSGEALFAGGGVTVTAPAAGTVRFLVESGQSVRMGQVIAEVGALPHRGVRRQPGLCQRAAHKLRARNEDEFRLLMSGCSRPTRRRQAVLRDAEGYALGDAKGGRKPRGAVWGWNRTYPPTGKGPPDRGREGAAPRQHPKHRYCAEMRPRSRCLPGIRHLCRRGILD